MIRRIGLLGGSFNPAHAGHRAISLAAIDALGLDEVWWLVSPGNPLKDSAGHGAAMTRGLRSARAMARRARIRPTDIEARLGTVYTVDTIAALVRRHPNHRFIWLMGGDNLAQFHRWRNWRAIAREVPIAVIARPGYDASRPRGCRDGLAAALRPARRPGDIVDDVETAGARAVALSPRPHLCDPASARRSRMAATFPAASGARRAFTLGVPLASSPQVSRSSDAEGVEALHQLVLTSLDDDQAVDTISIPLAGKSSIADHMVIASGRSTRQVASMASKLAEKIKAQCGRVARIEGLPTADWVLIDAGDVIVHLFRPEVRSFYNLERMWAFGDAPTPAPEA